MALRGNIITQNMNVPLHLCVFKCLQSVIMLLLKRNGKHEHYSRHHTVKNDDNFTNLNISRNTFKGHIALFYHIIFCKTAKIKFSAMILGVKFMEFCRMDIKEVYKCTKKAGNL